jgi:MSHA type pilus biogenesis protein MshL
MSGCAPEVPSPETKALYERYRQVLENATAPEKDTKPESKFQPVFKDVSPLQRRVTIAFHQENYENILFFLAYESGLSLVMDPSLKQEVPPEKERITLQMKNQPLEVVITKVCELIDAHFRLERGVLKIEPYEERIFNLGFLPVVKEGKTAMGGDVLGNIGQGGGGGATGGQISSPLKGEFSINADLSRESLDIYTNFEKTLSTLLSKKGVYNFNRLTGFLYVKDKPSRVKAVAAIIDEFKKKYKKQIILDAQIIEVELAKGHNLGVDWFEITNYLMGNNRVSLNTLDLGITTRSDQPSFALTISGQPNINLILNLLKEYGELKVVSNPKIRVLHSQPALISVGTSQSYIKEFKRDVTTGTATSTITYTTQTSSVFDGILLGLTPYVADEKEIFLHIVPIKSDIVELKDVRFGGDYFITLPKVNLREMTSIVKARPGDLLVIGGLILDKDKASEKKIAIPFISELFKTNMRESRKAELVILIRILAD